VFISGGGEVISSTVQSHLVYILLEQSRVLKVFVDLLAEFEFLDAFHFFFDINNCIE